MNVAKTRLVLLVVTAACLIAMPRTAGLARAGLVQVLDYSDSFTVGVNGRAVGGNPPNGATQYAVENTHGNPAATWTPYSAGTDFSFQTPASDAAYVALSPAPTGNAGATTGFMRPEKGITGSQALSDYGIAYGLRTDYVVSADAILPGTDRINISSFANLGDKITSPGALSVFFRADYSASPHAGIDIYAGGLAGTYEVVDWHQLGINDTNWHNLAVRFDQEDKNLWIYVDGTLTGMGGAEAPIDLTFDYVGTELAGAPLANYAYSNNVVAIGGANSSPGDHPWLDNFEVGRGPVTLEPLTRVLDTFDTTAYPAGVNTELGGPRQLGPDVPPSGLSYTQHLKSGDSAAIVGDQLVITSNSQGASLVGLDHDFSDLAGESYTASVDFLMNDQANSNSWNTLRLGSSNDSNVGTADIAVLMRRTGWWWVYVDGVFGPRSDEPEWDVLPAALEYHVELVIDETGPTKTFDLIVDGTLLVDDYAFVPDPAGHRYFGLGYYGYAGTMSYAFDNLMISAVPEPSTLLLLGFGMALIPFRRRRRR